MILLLSFQFFGQSNTYQKEITRGIDLREKQNTPWMSTGKELPTLLMKATLSGSITPYTNDSLDKGKQLTKAEFLERKTVPGSNIQPDTAYMDEFEKQEYLLSLKEGGDEPMYYFGKDLYQIEITETVYFSQKTNEFRNEIKSITIFLPAEHPENQKGYQIPIATYDFNEVINFFDNQPDAIWCNPANDAEHKSYADAFELRLFSSYILRVSNPTNLYIVDEFDGDQKQGILQAQEKEYELVEFESNLWEN